MRNDKGNVFNGLFSGENYDRGVSLAGFGLDLYREAVAEIPLKRGMRVLDLCCGTAAFSVAIAEATSGESRFDGVDLAPKQLVRAVRRTDPLPASFEFHQCSMDELPFDPETFDLAVSGMAFHEVPPEVRRGAINESARVLKPGGMFALVDWSGPERFGLASLLWLPFLPFERAKDNRRNTYPVLFRERGFLLSGDVYLKSVVRCQVFRRVRTAGAPRGEGSSAASMVNDGQVLEQKETLPGFRRHLEK
jgi:demethylmenaquinone methyltransferase/2-methoxy-6-polyprenyl-1,4-benzoquinol methylase